MTAQRHSVNNGFDLNSPTNRTGEIWVLDMARHYINGDALIQCDRDQKLAYLESSNPKNITIHERHGFELLGTVQVGGSPPICPMLRKPQPQQLR